MENKKKVQRWLQSRAKYAEKRRNLASSDVYGGVLVERQQRAYVPLAAGEDAQAAGWGARAAV
jgi:hypothetical protein